MANLLIGDVHGCYNELVKLLEQAHYSPAQDCLWFTGDLIARGKQSLEVLRFIKSLGSQAKVVLGNHDIHLLSIHAGLKKSKPKDYLDALLAAPDCDELIDWLRHQPLLQLEPNLKLVMTHAGIPPNWSLEDAVELSCFVEKRLQSDNYQKWLDKLYGNKPTQYSLSLSKSEKLRYSCNALTRMRYCYPDGELELTCKVAPDKAPSPLKPWFSYPSKVIEQGYCIAFGHWAALEGKWTPAQIYALDTGCCWGGKLTLLNIESQTIFSQPALLSL